MPNTSAGRALSIQIARSIGIARFSRTQPQAPSSPSLPGNHTHALLRELGLDTDTVAELEDAGVVAQRSSQ